MVTGPGTLASGLAVLAHFLGPGGALGHPVPRVFGAQAAIADIVERRGAGVGACLSGAGEIELELGRHRHLSQGTGTPGRRPVLFGSSRLKIDGLGLAALIFLKLVVQALVLLQSAHSGLFHRGDVNERIIAAVIRVDEAVAF